ncbi:MAG: hypothetical protein HUU47_07520 [Bacteroidetes bacterium]|nr:hypothetical protein [Bacteroidota bacterium]
MNQELKIELDSLQNDVDFYKTSIKEVSDEIIDEKISEFPIFIAHKSKIPFGEIILDHTELNTTWSISVSTLEEFMDKNIIENSKAGFFKANYKNPQEFICIFLITGISASFVFVPYKSENQKF